MSRLGLDRMVERSSLHLLSALLAGLACGFAARSFLAGLISLLVAIGAVILSDYLLGRRGKPGNKVSATPAEDSIQRAYESFLASGERAEAESLARQRRIGGWASVGLGFLGLSLSFFPLFAPGSFPAFPSLAVIFCIALVAGVSLLALEDCFPSRRKEWRRGR